MKTVSVIIPTYNEGENADRIYHQLVDLFDTGLTTYRLEIVFSDNASQDDTYDRITRLAEADPRVKGIRLSRNFGFQQNILSGLMNASGNCVIQLDADGEDPPELIREFLTQWEAGYDVVYGIRTERHESFLLTFQRKVFYRLLFKMASIDMPVDAGDFRLLDRRIVDLLIQRFKEHNPYLRGLVSYIGFRQKGIPYQRNARMIGSSKFSYLSYFGLAWDAITSFSRMPLKIVSALGVIMAGFAFAGMLFYLVLYLFVGVDIQGFTTIVLLLLLLFGIQLLSLGIFGEYISRIFDEVKGRPRIIIDKHCGFEEPPSEA
ncbi:MAG: glycosyltransferase family 2 protein [Kiritimatiellae bacterium]|nr:glycosyltransferase family 2 protein [Kiritimatiellia bacterium]